MYKCTNCGFKKIYLVGCDCTVGHCYKQFHTKYHSGDFTDFSILVPAWKIMKALIPDDVKIVNINPKGLKGIFEDVYT